MDLERVSVVIRQRRLGETLDLGTALGRRAWRTSVAGSLMLALPVWLVAHALLSVWPAWVPLALCWLLKPLFERVPLAVIGRGFFGESGNAWGFVRALTWPPLGELLAQLTFRRLTPARAYLAPVEQLEGLVGAARRDRVATIGRAHVGVAWGIAAVGVLTELSLLITLYLFVVSMGPESWALGDLLPDYQVVGPEWRAWVANAWVLLVMVAVMPFYVGIGFALYIQRRIDLEGWDIELSLRRLARRVQRERGDEPAAEAVG